MWTRRELKEKAKEALKRNYWKAVLVSALFALLGGGFSAGSGSPTGVSSVIQMEGTKDNLDLDAVSGLGYEMEWPELEGMDSTELVAVVALMVVVFLVIFVIIMIISIVVDIFLLNPFDMGVYRFMLKDLDEAADVKELAFGFDHCYKNVVKVMFCRDLSIFLWALLFIIPGVYKVYQYRMVPYILTERPDMDYKEALNLSKNMMDGQKWNAFVLDLSFILWHILGAITFGIVEIFYVAPYKNLTDAALYQKLAADKDENTSVIDMD